jgi:threonine dehydratase
MSVQFNDVQNAYAAIKDSTIRTPTVKAARLSLHLGVEIYLKLENLQHTNAFKARGALNKLLTLNEKEKKNGVIACSAGNHAQGVAYHAQRLGLPATIVMPEHTPFNKISKTKDFGAQIVIHGKNFDDSVEETQRLAKKDNFTFIHPYDDVAVVAGQGTIGLEMMEQRPDLDTIVVPIGGGGLMAGVATAVKGVNPKVEIIGVQVDSHAAVKAQIEGAKACIGGASLAEGIAVKEPSARNVDIIKKLVSRIDVVNDSEIEKAIFDLLSDEKLVIEGAAGAGLAAVENNLEYFKGRKVGIILTGGNIDSRLLSTLIMRGMMREGRITRLRFEMDDTPGQLADISRIIGEAGANVVEVIHQRLMQTVSLKRAELDVVIEARDKFHAQEIIDRLMVAGFNVVSVN